ncbi:WD40/YVTN repeat-like-containing domain,WD40 repeat,WD40-repeat-containing domain [Cinara cedri]|uniref:WD40/YVTN repeat-like-containing domain,WD40 repeat,WD40-repeat-containing domain n=1 Tax=Cinara cedri TaxID=506608 RepID=A0A5E4NPU0_9HEMI|nr:WD40/YVTN repeat-like-containing domain,WD40 repeat,WD40-repeat-containing domain [Cinara cedri]
MQNSSTYAEFIGRKVNKVRWKPEDLMASTMFVTGSWDNENDNVLELWGLTSGNGNSAIDFPPKLLDSKEQNGDVTQIKFLDNKFVAVSTDSGTVKLYRIIGENEAPTVHLEEVTSWENLHSYGKKNKCACTDLAVCNYLLATIGADHKLNIISLNTKQVHQVVEEISSSLLTCVCFLTDTQVLCCNSLSQMKLWDLRVNKSDITADINNFSQNQMAIGCIAQHPSQKHLIFTGSEEGDVGVWDMRTNSLLTTMSSGDPSSITELAFHPLEPDHLFSCSSGGKLLQWSSKKSYLCQIDPGDLEYSNFWINTDKVKTKLTVNTVMQPICDPINSLDIQKQQLICGADDEAVYFKQNLNL